jgi:Domain of unknown function (DU1801)
MAKAELKTKKTKASVGEFIDGVADDRRKDCRALVKLMKKATGADAKMWGPSIIGFGDYSYVSEKTGRAGDWFQIGFSPRKADLTLYLMGGLSRHSKRIAKLGKHKVAGSCLHIKRLEDVDLAVLEDLLAASVRYLETGKS